MSALDFPEGWRTRLPHMDLRMQAVWANSFKACREQVHAAPMVDLSAIPEGWWLYGLFHNHTPTKYRDEQHVPFDESGHGEPWTCKLQHMTGGKLIEVSGPSAQTAVLLAVAEIEIGIRDERWDW